VALLTLPGGLPLPRLVKFSDFPASNLFILI